MKTMQNRIPDHKQCEFCDRLFVIPGSYVGEPYVREILDNGEYEERMLKAHGKVWIPKGGRGR